MAETLLSLATGLGLSTAAGFNAYLPLLITGIVFLVIWVVRRSRRRRRSSPGPAAP